MDIKSLAEQEYNSAIAYLKISGDPNNTIKKLLKCQSYIEEVINTEHDQDIIHTFKKNLINTDTIINAILEHKTMGNA